MRQRFTVNAVGELEDRDGRVLGKLVSLTLETREAAGTIGVAVPSGEQQTLEGEGTPRPPSDVERVWAHYVEVMAPRHAELEEQSRKIIREALKVATVEECCRAIDGNRASAWHQGENEKRRKYNKLGQVLKGRPRLGETTRDRIDFFLDLAEKAGLDSQGSSANYAKVRQAKRLVLDAAEFPGDEQVVRRGEEAARWLRDIGWLVEYGDDGRPTFRMAESGG